MKNDGIVTALPHIQHAAGHLVECWDALQEAEWLTGIEISVDDLSTFAVDLDYPEDSRLNTEGRIYEWVAEIVG